MLASLASFSTLQQEKTLTDNIISDPSIGTKRYETSDSIMKVLTWDPWERTGRKAKVCCRNLHFNQVNLCFQRRKTPLSKASTSKPIPEETLKHHGDEVQQTPVEEHEEDFENYEYQPYKPNVKSVKFTNEVMVVHFNREEVLGESKEPLKKELDQQVRNKEMRRGHMFIQGSEFNKFI